MPADELRDAVLAAVNDGKDLTLDLDRIDHLDGSALQILLAAEKDMKERGQSFRLARASAHLRKWFEFAGAGDRFFHDGNDQQ
jgi:anti-anti-sigma factor